MRFRIWFESQIKIFPIGNIFIPPQKIFYNTIEKYKATPSERLPTGVIDDGRKFPGWRPMEDENGIPFSHDSQHPDIYITDGVHRILAKVQLNHKSIEIEVEDGKFY